MTKTIIQCAGAIFRLPNGAVILQQRDNKPGINSPGMVHIFGGTSLPGETGRQTMEREVVEETAVSKEYLKQAEILGTFDEDGKIPPGIHRNDIYVIPCQSKNDLQLLEGAGHVVISRKTDIAKIPLTSITKRVLAKIGFEE